MWEWQELPPAIIGQEDALLEIAYVGNRGLKLPAFRNLNQLPVVFNEAGAPGAGLCPLAAFGLNADIQLLENLAISNYHSLTASKAGETIFLWHLWAVGLHLGQSSD